MATPSRPTRSAAARATAEEIAERRARVYDLHLVGGSVRSIADTLGIPRSTVQDDINAVIRSRTWEETQHLRKAAQGRSDALLAEHVRLYWRASRGAAAVGTPGEPNYQPPVEPDLRLANDIAGTLVAIEGRRAKLEGTDAPTLTRISVMSDADIDEAIAARRAQLRVVNPDHPLVAGRAVEQPALGAGTDDRREAR